MYEHYIPNGYGLLVCRLDLLYTQSMHIIDHKWIGLAEGYQTVHTLQTKLETEFGRAVQAGHRQKFRRVLTEWQKKRRVFFALLALAILSVVGLCVMSFYIRRDAVCVVVYWAMLVTVIVVTAAVAGRSYIREAINRPLPQYVKELGVDLEGRWWESLAPQELAAPKGNDKKSPDFLNLLAQSLPGVGLLRAKKDSLLLLAPSGIWLFVTRDWGGSILKQDGVWKQKTSRREEKAYEQSPDDQWLHSKKEITEMLEKNLPSHAWTARLTQGGVAFSNPDAKLDKTQIQGNTASYGSVKAWAERVRRAAPAEDFTLEMQLDVLDVLMLGNEAEQPLLSKSEAEQLYQQAAEELREAVAKMVK